LIILQANHDFLVINAKKVAPFHALSSLDVREEKLWFTALSLVSFFYSFTSFFTLSFSFYFYFSFSFSSFSLPSRLTFSSFSTLTLTSLTLYMTEANVL
jgi:hypothetical protein